MPVVRAAATDQPALLFFDQDCGLCVLTSEWLGRRVDQMRLRPVPVAKAFLEPSVAAHVGDRELLATIHYLAPDGTLLTGPRAVLAAGRHVPRWAVLARLADHRLGHVLLEPIYEWVARHRRQIGRRLGLPEACRLPGPAQST